MARLACLAAPLRSILVACICIFGAWKFVGVVKPFYPVEQWLVWRLLGVWGYVLLLNIACLAGGATVLRRLLGRDQPPVLERVVLSMAIGLVVFVLGMYVAGFVGAFHPAVALSLPLLLVAVGVGGLRSLARDVAKLLRSRSELSGCARVAAMVAAGIGAVYAALVVIEAIDISAVNFDANWYHFPIAQDYARVGKILPQPGDNHRAFPHLTSILHTWALLVPGFDILPLRWTLSLQIEASIVLWRVAAVGAGLCWALDWKRPHGTWVVFFLFPSVFIYDQNVGGSADHVLGFFSVPILLALARVLRDFDLRWGVVLGVVLGGHMLTKYQAVYLFVAVTLIGLLRWSYLALGRAIPKLRDRSFPPLAAIGKGLGVIVVTTAVVTAPHFVKNAVFHKNPLYPLAQSVFTSSTPQVPPGYYQSTPGPAAFAPEAEGLERQLWAGEMLYTYSFETRNRSLTKHRPFMGALFSLLLPCLPFVRRSRRTWLAFAVAAIAFFVWANTAPNDRYLLSFYDVMIVIAGALAVRIWQLGWLPRMALVPVVALQLFWGGDAPIFYGWKRLRATHQLIVGGYKRQKLPRRLAAKSAQQKVTQATPEDAVIVVRNYKGLLGLDRTVLNDFPVSAGGYISYSHLRDARDLWLHLEDRGATHLLYPHGQRLPQRLNNTVLFGELYHRYGVGGRTIGRLRLAELPPEPPPASVPFEVLVNGVREYPDGLYRVEQLDVGRSNPESFTPAPQPIEASTPENWRALVERASAAMTCNTTGPQMKAALRERFRPVESWGKCQLYLLR